MSYSIPLRLLPFSYVLLFVALLNSVLQNTSCWVGCYCVVILLILENHWTFWSCEMTVTSVIREKIVLVRWRWCWNWERLQRCRTLGAVAHKSLHRGDDGESREEWKPETWSWVGCVYFVRWLNLDDSSEGQCGAGLDFSCGWVNSDYKTRTSHFSIFSHHCQQLVAKSCWLYLQSTQWILPMDFTSTTLAQAALYCLDWLLQHLLNWCHGICSFPLPSIFLMSVTVLLSVCPSDHFTLWFHLLCDFLILLR